MIRLRETMAPQWLSLAALACVLGSIGCPGMSFTCDAGWVKFEDACYLFASNVSVNFMDAESYCNNMDSLLVQVESEAENNFIKSHLTANHVWEEFWMGLTDNVTEKEWVWYDSQAAVEYNDWRPHEPNNAHQENCAVFALRDYNWNDVHCRDLHEPICELVYVPPNILG